MTFWHVRNHSNGALEVFLGWIEASIVTQGVSVNPDEGEISKQWLVL